MFALNKGRLGIYGIFFVLFFLVLSLFFFFSGTDFFDGLFSSDLNESVAQEEYDFVPISLSGSLNNAFFENNVLIIRKGGMAHIDLEEGLYEVFVDVQKCSSFVVNRTRSGVSYNSLRERVVLRDGSWEVERLSSEERKKALIDERVHTLFIREKDTWESYSLPLDDSLVLNSSGVVSFNYNSLCDSSVYIRVRDLS